MNIHVSKIALQPNKPTADHHAIEMEGWDTVTW